MSYKASLSSQVEALLSMAANNLTYSAVKTASASSVLSKNSIEGPEAKAFSKLAAELRSYADSEPTYEDLDRYIRGL
jgi:hypothetical protein